MKTVINCQYCGSKIVEYRFGLNKGLKVFLKKLYEAEGPVKTDSLDLSYSQRTNSQKLRYWELAIPHITPENIRKLGWWKITEKGKRFVNGEITIPKYVFTQKGQVTRFEGPQILFCDVGDGYDYHGDYVDQIKQTGLQK